MMLFLPKMCRKMEAYAAAPACFFLYFFSRLCLHACQGLQSRGAAPDKNTYRLNAVASLKLRILLLLSLSSSFVDLLHRGLCQGF